MLKQNLKKEILDMIDKIDNETILRKIKFIVIGISGKKIKA
ncbi:Uncharacterised protein [[Clostridium] sordellii]|nr:hypothetical protein [Paeniclostridium sordellii]CEP50254.1 Uncharacterised protein [[Clostridium] sordellii] [Paeniclostridium sordellii]